MVFATKSNIKKNNNKNSNVKSPHSVHCGLKLSLPAGQEVI